MNLPVTDFIAAGTGPSRMFYAAVNGDNVYSSPDGITWMPMSGLGTIPNNEARGRIALAAAGSSPNIVYALIGNDTLFRLDSSKGTTFQKVGNFPSALFGPYDSQQGYDLVVAVDSSDQITSTNTDLNTVTMTDKHVVHRNTHLVALGSKPLIHSSRLIAINFHNPYHDSEVFDFEFRRQNFPGEVSLLLPKLSELSPTEPQLEGFRLQRRDESGHNLRQMIGDWIADLGELLENIGQRIEGYPPDVRNRIAQQHEHRREKLERLDHRHILMAQAGTSPATVTGVHIPPRSAVLGAFSVTPPPGAARNDRYRLDVIQRRQGKILGGSSYVIAIV